MNVVREINKINERELDLGTTGSWHDDYKDSAYVFVGGLNTELTEGDVITIFSQYGEVMDVNMPRDKATGKPRGFAFLMYEDQRSTVLAVDNLNGAKVLERTLRVDHVKNYKQPKVKGEDGDPEEREEQSLNAKPELIIDHDAASDSSGSSGPEIDPEDPMRDYLLAQRKERKALKKIKKSKDKHTDETAEERRIRKQRKKERKERKLKRSEGMRGVEELLQELQGRDRRDPVPERRSSYRQPRSSSRDPRKEHRMDVDGDDRYRHRSSEDRRSRKYSRTPPRRSSSPYHPRRQLSTSRSPSPTNRDQRFRKGEGNADSRKRHHDQMSSPRRRMDYD